MIQIEASFFLIWAVLLLILPLDWCLAAVFAAIVHELGHIAVLLLLGGKIHSVKIRAEGALIEGNLSGTWNVLLSTLAGPASSFVLLLFLHICPKLALCALVQGSFNLLPMMPLDGGRALLCFLELRNVKSPDKILLWTERITYILFFALSLLAFLYLGLGIWSVFFASTLILKGFLRKIPCKRR